MEQYEQEIFDTEKAFAQLAAEQGVKAAFLAYAADEAVLSRNNKIIKGKQAIADYFDQQTFQEVRLDWAPDFVSVAASGDLGYTFGKFTFSATDPTGKRIEADGIFHTVWRRQQNGEWRYVWD